MPGCCVGRVRVQPRPRCPPPWSPLSVIVPSPAGGNVLDVVSFAVAVQIRMSAVGTRARLAVAVPQDAQFSPNTFISALLTLGWQVLEEARFTGLQRPEVEVTAVERVETVIVTVSSCHTAGRRRAPARPGTG